MAISLCLFSGPLGFVECDQVFLAQGAPDWNILLPFEHFHNLFETLSALGFLMGDKGPD